MDATSNYRDNWINPRFKIAALWASMLFVYVYVDVFGLFRADVRANIEAGEIGGFTIDQTFLFATTSYVLIPILALSLTMLLPVGVVRWLNIVVAALYIPTILASVGGEWTYYILGSAVEVMLLVGVIFFAWTWPKAPPSQAIESA